MALSLLEETHVLQLAATWRGFLLHPNVPKIAPLALPSTLLPTCPPTRRDGPMAFMAIILWTPMTFNEHFLNLGLGRMYTIVVHAASST